jgi:integrase
MLSEPSDALRKADRDALWEYRRVLRRKGYSDATTRLYVNAARRAARYFERCGRTIGTATDRDVLGFFDGLPPGRETRRGARKALVALYEALGRSEARNPALVLPRLPGSKRTPRPITREDYIAFLAECARLGGFHEVVGVLFATTGCRFSEIRRLRWSAVRFGSEPAIEVVGKGAACRGPKVRSVPLHPLAVDALRRWRLEVPGREEVFPSPTSSKDGYRGENAFRDAFTEIVHAARIDEHVTPHRMRHSVATFAVEATLDLRAVQELLGHGSLSTTEQYVGLSGGRVRDAVASLPTNREDSK